MAVGLVRRLVGLKGRKPLSGAPILRWLSIAWGGLFLQDGRRWHDAMGEEVDD